MNQKTLNRIKQLTANNDHGEAYLTAANVLGQPDLVATFTAINRRHAELGQLPDFLNQERYCAYQRLMAVAKKILLPAELFIALEPSMKKSLFVAVALALFSLGACAATETSWTYTAFDEGTGEQTGSGDLVLTEYPNYSTVQIVAGPMGPCAYGKLDASVERTPEAVVITIEPVEPGCKKVRLSLNADGSGGTREVLSKGKWELDPHDRGLSLR
jgi:hypothetical protein